MTISPHLSPDIARERRHRLQAEALEERQAREARRLRARWGRRRNRGA